MSVSSRDEEKDTHKPKDHVIPTDADKNKKYVRIWRIEASREFILLAMMLLIGLGFYAYNPLQVNLNTQQILSNQDGNSGKLSALIQGLDDAQKNSGLPFIKLLLLFDLDHERDINKIMEKLDIPNTHFVDVNGTHAFTEQGSFKLPYDVSNITSLFNETGPFSWPLYNTSPTPN